MNIGIYDNPNIRIDNQFFMPKHKDRIVEQILRYYPEDRKSKYDSMKYKQVYAILYKLKSSKRRMTN